jgi:glucose-6-phosphate-specific signal transduction histidine kinase
MSSGIAAPIGGRFLRARTLGHESAREYERTRLRRYLRVTTLQALENIAGSSAETDAGALIAMADEAATDLRTLAGKLTAVKGGTAAAELQREVGAMVHDTALQALEYLACDGYGAELDADTVRKIASDAAIEMRGHLLRLGAPEPCELVSALEQVVSTAQRRGTVEVKMVTELNGSVYGAEAVALVGAVREALNNVHKHAKASSVVVRCETSEAGARVVVSDDGVGVDLAHAVAGIGLRRSIIERMESSGGCATVASAPGHGTLVTLTTGTTQEVAA